MKTQRILTHIAELDHALGGGMMPGESLMIEGELGTGKTTLCMQIQYNHLKLNQGCGVFVSFLQSCRSIIDKFAQFGWNIHEFLENGHLKVVDVHSVITGTSQDVKLLESERQGVVFIGYADYHSYFTEVSGVVQALIEQTGKVNVDVIDCCWFMLETAQTKTNEPEPWRGVMKYYDRLRERLGGATGVGLGLHIFTTAAGNEHLRAQLRQIEPGLIELRRIDFSDKSERSLKVHRLRASEHRTDELKFYIDSARGIQFYSD